MKAWIRKIISIYFLIKYCVLLASDLKQIYENKLHLLLLFEGEVC